MTANNNPQGVYTSTYIRLLFDYLEARGLDAVAILAEPAPPADDRGLGRYPAEKWRNLLERAAKALDDPLLGLHLGQHITPAHLGVIGYVLQSCATLAAALQRIQEYELLISDVAQLHTRIDGDCIELRWERAPVMLGPLIDETALTAYVQLARHFTGQASAGPTLVSFINPPPADLKPYEDYFGCPVLFGQNVTRIRLHLQMLAQPLRQADAALLDMMAQQAASLLAALPESNDLVRAVRAVIARLAREGELDIERAAASLHQSSRTLHRHLAAQGWNFRQLRDDTRRRLAEDYLHDSRLSLSEVAWLLGYSEPSAFTRAFRRWTGKSPSVWRADQTSLS